MAESPARSLSEDKVIAAKLRLLEGYRDEMRSLSTQLIAVRLNRNDLIRTLIREHDVSWRTVAESAGISNPHITNILDKEGV